VLPSSRYFAETSRRDKAGFGFNSKARKLFFTAKSPGAPRVLPGPQMGADETQIKTSVKICVNLWLKPWRSLRLGG
jgi:hypothetical protein